jgi:hypothetical protein
MPSERHEPIKRRRPALSCIECRRRKIKCDQRRPCFNCKATHFSCQYQSLPHRRPEQALQLTDQQCIARPNSSSNEVQSSTSTHDVRHADCASVLVNRSSGTTSNSNTARNHEETDQSLDSRVRRLEDKLQHTIATISATTEHARDHGDLAFNKTRISRGHQMVAQLAQVSNLSTPVRSDRSNAGIELREYSTFPEAD